MLITYEVMTLILKVPKLFLVLIKAITLPLFFLKSKLEPWFGEMLIISFMERKETKMIIINDRWYWLFPMHSNMTGGKS